MGLPDSEKHSIADNEDFIRLVQVAMEEPDIKKKMETLLSLDSFNRKSMINTWIEELKLQKAPEKFIEGISALTDNGIAKKVLKIIGGNRDR